MTIDIKTGFEKINQIIKACITKEMAQNGLLEDVETFIDSYYEDGQIDEPFVWMNQHPTNAERQADISQTMELVTPFEFDCGVYNTDLGTANLESQNLANRVILSILRNWLQAQSEIIPNKRLIRRIGLETYSPMGYFEVAGKSDRVPVTGVVLNVYHTVNWSLCCKQLNNGE